MNPKNVLAIAVAVIASAALPAAADDYTDAYDYTSIAGGPKNEQNKKAAVQAFIRDILASDDSTELPKLKEHGSTVKLVRGFKTFLPVVSKQLADSTALPAPKKAELAKVLKNGFKLLQFTVGKGGSRNEGGTINVALVEIGAGRKATKFALYHEIGHATYSALYERHKDKIGALVPELAKMPKNFQLEYFADAIAVRIMKAEGETPANVVAAAKTLFAEEGTDGSHPPGNDRVRFAKTVYARK